MTKLTTWMREDLAKALLRHRFGADAQAFLAAKSDFAVAVYRDIYSAAERQAMAELPSGWLVDGDDIGVQFGEGRNYVRLNFNGATHSSIANVLPSALERKTLRIQSQHQHGCVRVYEHTHPLSAQFDEIKGRQSDLERAIATAKHQSEAALASASTIGKLISIWPEIEPFASKYLDKPKPVPALPTTELNALLDLPVAEAA